MNIYSFARNQFGATAIALITISSLLMSALPAAFFVAHAEEPAQTVVTESVQNSITDDSNSQQSIVEETTSESEFNDGSQDNFDTPQTDQGLEGVDQEEGGFFGSLLSLFSRESEPTNNYQGEVSIPYCEDNLLDNGSFESPEVTRSEKWQEFSTVAPWTITNASNETPTTLELMRNWNGNEAADGSQYVELDGKHSTAIAQTIPTLVGGTYELSWAFAARHDIGAAHNNLGVYINDEEVATEGPKSGVSPLSVGNWQYGTKTFVATTENTQIGFADLGPSDSFGTYLDNAQLCLKKEPPRPSEPEVCSIKGAVVRMSENALTFNGRPVDANRRTVTGLATVAPYSNFFGMDGNNWSPSDFLTLGVGGFVVYEFTDKVVVNQTGPDIAIWEITGGSVNQQSNAKATIEVSQDGITFIPAGSITGDGLVDIGPSALPYVKFVKVTDNSASIGGDDGGDGFDVDAITIINGSCGNQPEVQQCNLSILSSTQTVVEETNLNAVETYKGNSRWTASIPGAKWIWELYKVLNPTADTTRTFVETFTITNPTNATLKIAADNGYQVFLNGVSVVNNLAVENNYQDDTQDTIPLTLNSGVNELRIVVKNFAQAGGTFESNPAGALYELTATGSSNCARTTAVKTSGPVTMCKVDTNERPLPGWTLTLLGSKVEDVVVPAGNAAGINTIASLNVGKSYVAKASGTWNNNRGPLNIVDAEYSTEDNWLTQMDGFTGFGSNILELQINTAGFDPASNWGTYNTSHTYARSFVQNSAGPANFSIYDTNYGDNTGSLTVALYEGFAGITGQNGCVTFQNVPYGTYTAGEIMQDGYEYVSGAGEVVVNHQTGPVTIVNKFVPKYSDETQTVTVTGNTLNLADPASTGWYFDSVAPFIAPYQFLAGNASIGTGSLFAGPIGSTPQNKFIATYQGFWPVKTLKSISYDFKINTNSAADENEFYLNIYANFGSSPATKFFDCRYDVVPTVGMLNGYTTITFNVSDAVAVSPSSCPATLAAMEAVSSGSIVRAIALNVGDTGTQDTGVSGYFDNVVVKTQDDTLLQKKTTIFDFEAAPIIIEPPIDVCPNLPENQSVIPKGYEKVGDSANCTLIPVTPVDVCPNLPDTQTSIPTGYQKLAGSEDCTLIPVEEGPDDENPIDETPEPETSSRRGGSSSGTRLPDLAQADVQPLVLGASTGQCGMLLTEYMRMGQTNNPLQVQLLQLFLIGQGYGEVKVTGVFDATTDAAVRALQMKYQSEVLTPWFTAGIVPHNNPTGWVYQLTRWKINNIVCPGSEPMPDLI